MFLERLSCNHACCTLLASTWHVIVLHPLTVHHETSLHGCWH